MNSELMNKVIAAVKEAAEIMKSDYTVETKGEKENIVTSNDKAVQKFLYTKLAEILPSSGFFGEEDVTSYKPSEYVWIVDPIDGTTNYARNIRDCGISVGLERSGELILGVIYLPYHDEIYHAEKGCGAYMNGKPIKVSDKKFGNGILCTALCVYKKELSDICLSILNDAYSKCADFRRFGSAAAELAYLASGKCDLYFEIRLFPWDFAAGYVIIKEAGGCIASLNGASLNLRKPCTFIAANNEENLKILSDTVSAHLDESVEI